MSYRRSSRALPKPHRRWRWLVALLVLHFAFVLPDEPTSAGWGALLRLPVELPIVVLVLIAWPPRRWAFLHPLATAALGLLVLLKLADIAMQASLGRPFRPLLDLHLVGAGFELLSAAFGPIETVALAIAAGVVAIGVIIGLHRAIGVLRPTAFWRGRLAAVAACSAAVAGAAHLGASAGSSPTFTTAETSRSVRDHLQALGHGLADRARFRAELADDPGAELDTDRLLARLRGIDVLFLFVESYGRSTIENQPYARTVQATLADFEKATAAAGLAARSAWLTAPIRGGQSWLAHATLLAGLKVDDQRRYESLIVSDRQTLVGDFRRAGWRTIAVLPATNRPWPEGRFFAFDRIYAAKDLGYAGEPFNWVTMPDQYTLSAFQRLELDRHDRPAIMASVALISSHAPWTPIPPLLDWGAVGDGAVFTPHARAGDAPEVVWSDTERIRAQYLRSIEYVLHTLGSWVARAAREESMFVILGDHQPVGFVAGEGDSFDVPIHVLSPSPRVLDVVDDWGWTRGMRPNATSPVWSMETLRGRLLDAFSGRPADAAADAGSGAGAAGGAAGSFDGVRAHPTNG